MLLQIQLHLFDRTSLMATLVILVVAVVVLFLLPAPSFGSFAGGSLCPRMEPGFLYALSSQCPAWIEHSTPLEVDGETLDSELSNAKRDKYYSVIFYASWCPFSRNLRPVFDALSSNFPQIRHFAVEESSAMPIVLSRYGIRSFPSILLAKGATKIHYRGSKDLSFLVRFYKEFTGLDPSNDFVIENSEKSRFTQPPAVPNGAMFFMETITREPYVAFGVLFLFLRTLVAFSPKIFSVVKSVWLSHLWRPSTGIFRERSQLLERLHHHVVDVKKVWSNLKLKNFKSGAKNARVWASSLASVALGEPSSSRGVGLGS